MHNYLEFNYIYLGSNVSPYEQISNYKPLCHTLVFFVMFTFIVVILAVAGVIVVISIIIRQEVSVPHFVINPWDSTTE